MSYGKKWYAVYTKPRWEKKVNMLLLEKGFESYCPLNKVERRWSDRNKIVEDPLFKSYVFVRIKEDERQAVRLINGVVNFVYWLGKPAIVKDKEIEIIKLFLRDHINVEVGSLDINTEEKIRIRNGVFMDFEGKVLSVRTNHVIVALEGIGFYLKARVNKSDLEPIITQNRKSQ